MICVYIVLFYLYRRDIIYILIRLILRMNFFLMQFWVSFYEIPTRVSDEC